MRRRNDPDAPADADRAVKKEYDETVDPPL
jgi:hypothetical protein